MIFSDGRTCPAPYLQLPILNATIDPCTMTFVTHPADRHLASAVCDELEVNGGNCTKMRSPLHEASQHQPRINNLCPGRKSWVKVGSDQAQTGLRTSSHEDSFRAVPIQDQHRITPALIAAACWWFTGPLVPLALPGTRLLSSCLPVSHTRKSRDNRHRSTCHCSSV